MARHAKSLNRDFPEFGLNIVKLGGVCHEWAPLSRHGRVRVEVGEAKVLMRSWRTTFHAANDWNFACTSEANTLIQGPESEIQACVTVVGASSPAPVATVETPSDVLTTIGAGSIILNNVSAYTPEQQHALLTWLDADGVGVRLISTSSERLFDLVECGRFLETLYLSIECHPDRLHGLFLRQDFSVSPNRAAHALCRPRSGARQRSDTRWSREHQA